MVDTRIVKVYKMTEGERALYKGIRGEKAKKEFLKVITSSRKPETIKTSK